MADLLERNGEIAHDLARLGIVVGREVTRLVDEIYAAADGLRENHNTAHHILDQLVVRQARLIEERDRLTATIWIMQKARDWDKVSPEADEFRRALIEDKLTIDRLAAQLAGMTGERDAERQISVEWERKCEQYIAALAAARRVVLLTVLEMLPDEPAPAHHSVYIRERRAALLEFADEIRAMLGKEPAPEMTTEE